MDFSSFRPAPPAKDAAGSSGKPIAFGLVQNGSSDTKSGDGTPFRHRVLLVEDQADVAKATTMGLEYLGAEVTVATTGEEALRLAPTMCPTLVLLDIDLPGISGHEAGRRLRQMPELNSTVLVALTSWDTLEMRRLSAESGLTEHLVKPLDLDALAALLKRTAPAP